MSEPIVLDDKKLRRLQLLQVEMLREIDRICKKNGIKYSIIAGTLLGAVRHRGFIPWDDDADVTMLRSEYEKFIIACEKDLDKEKYFLQNSDTDEFYRWGYAKLRLNGTKYIRYGQENIKCHSGVSIDIFPLDNVPDGKIQRIFHKFHCFIIRKFLWSKAGMKSEKSRFKRVLFTIMSWVPKKTIFSHFEKFYKKNNKNDTELVRVITFPTPPKTYGYYKKWYKNLSEIEFEGYTFSALKDKEEYLSFRYGDYMVLPPENERRHHYASEIYF